MTTAGSLSIDAYVEGVRRADRTVLARALTLVESRRDEDVRRAQELLARLLPHTGRAVRVGVSGVPGVGKSTLLEALGLRLVSQGRRVGVLAVDPTSSRTGGSILGDKSRMAGLAADERAFIRPSPSGDAQGGVARRTRESLLVLEAAGFDPVFVETMGVGQSETAVADMVDSFLLLALPGAGDELQGIKKGVMELADVVAVNKADGDNEARAREAVSAARAALHLVRQSSEGWRPRVLAVSAQTGAGLDELWRAVLEHREWLAQSGELEHRRAAQRVRWMWREIDDALLDSFRAHAAVRGLLAEVEAAVAAGRLTATEGALRLLDTYRRGPAR